jgi:iron(III) transport system ATP-binding protein
VFRPQDARIGAGEPGMASVPGTIIHREFLGSTIRYAVRVGTAEVAVDTPFHMGDVLHEGGASVSLGVPTQALLWLPP